MAETVSVVRAGRTETYVVGEERADGSLVLLPQPRAEPAATRPAATLTPAVGASVLEVDGLTVSYGPKVAVADVSLRIQPGEIFGLLGPNGAGKTSTLSAIEGLLKPRAGAVRVAGFDIRRQPMLAKTRMGVQLQATSFQPDLTISQVLRLYAGLYGVRLGAAEVHSRLAEVGLEAEAGKPFSQLSGGQQQRLSLQIAVVHSPALLLLDEPTSGLDAQSRRQLWSRIEQLRDGGGSILLTTHSMEEAQAVCDRVAIIDHGQLLTAETPAELIVKHRDDPRVRAVAHGEVTLEDVFIGLTGSEIRD